MKYSGSDCNFPYHQQNGIDDCGAAVAQMLLATRGAGIIQQSELDGVLGRNDIPGPKALADALNAELATAAYAEDLDACADALTLRIFADLLAARPGTEIAIPALVFSGPHWVAIGGAQYDATDRDHVQLFGFFLNDPGPPAQSSAMQHSAQDLCGTGYERGSRNTYVTSYAWLRDYWSIPQEAGQYATVRALPQRDAGSGLHIYMAPDSSEPATCQTAPSIAEKGLQDHGLRDRGPLSKYLTGATVSEAAPKPLMAFDEDGGNLKSFLVTLIKNGSVCGTAWVDRLSGQFMGVEFPPTLATHALETETFVLRTLRTHNEVASLLSADAFDPDDVRVNPMLRWKPCAESTSPYRPFYEAVVYGKKLYIDMYGNVYDQLHPPR